MSSESDSSKETSRTWRLIAYKFPVINTQKWLPKLNIITTDGLWHYTETCHCTIAFTYFGLFFYFCFFILCYFYHYFCLFIYLFIYGKACIYSIHQEIKPQYKNIKTEWTFPPGNLLRQNPYINVNVVEWIYYPTCTKMWRVINRHLM